jgi:autotransporter-associated beta strand protein
VDWNKDGKPDLLTGEWDGHIRVYLNVGPTRAIPVFDSFAYLRVGGNEFSVSGGFSTPEVVDWNNDGRRDLVVGDGNGGVHLLINTGSDSAPQFAADVPIYDGGLEIGRASPAVADVNMDGKKDMVVGGTSGRLFYFENQGTDAAPKFNGYELLQAAGTTIEVRPYSRPALVDWNNDGSVDVLNGLLPGDVWLYLSAATPPGAPPQVTGTDPTAIEAGGALASLVTQFQVSFNSELDATDANAPASYELRRAGPDGLLDGSDDVVMSLTPSYTYNPSKKTSVATISTDTLLPDLYRFTARGAGASALHDTAGNALDGDRNGTAGDDYVRTFEVQRVWTGSTGTWSTPDNWLGGAPQLTAQEHLLFAGAGCSCSNDLPAGRVFRALTLAGPGFTLTGNRIMLNPSGGIAVDNSFSSAGTTTLGLPVTLGSAATFQVAAGDGSLCLDPAATVDTNACDLTLEAGDWGTMLLHGAVRGSGAVVKTGAGTAVLDGANIYSGGTNVRGGTLRIANARAVPHQDDLTIGSGAQVVFDLGIIQLPVRQPVMHAGSLQSGAASVSAAAAAINQPSPAAEVVSFHTLPPSPVAGEGCTLRFTGARAARTIPGVIALASIASPSKAARAKAVDKAIQALVGRSHEESQNWLWLAEPWGHRKSWKGTARGGNVAEGATACPLPALGH